MMSFESEPAGSPQEYSFDELSDAAELLDSVEAGDDPGAADYHRKLEAEADAWLEQGASEPDPTDTAAGKSEDSRSDQELADAIRNGETTAFGALWQRHADYAGAVAVTNAVRFGVTSADGEETSQHIAERLLRRLTSAELAPLDLETEENATKRYIATVARNYYHDIVKSSAYRSGSISLSEKGEDRWQMPDDNRGPADELEVKETREETRLAVANYLDVLALHSTGQAAVLRLRFIEGLSVTETAERMDTTIGACKTMQHRAIDSMRKLLDGETLRSGREQNILQELNKPEPQLIKIQQPAPSSQEERRLQYLHEQDARAVLHYYASYADKLRQYIAADPAVEDVELILRNVFWQVALWSRPKGEVGISSARYNILSSLERLADNEIAGIEDKKVDQPVKQDFFIHELARRIRSPYARRIFESWYTEGNNHVHKIQEQFGLEPRKARNYIDDCHRAATKTLKDRATQTLNDLSTDAPTTIRPPHHSKRHLYDPYLAVQGDVSFNNGSGLNEVWNAYQPSIDAVCHWHAKRSGRLFEDIRTDAYLYLHTWFERVADKWADPAIAPLQRESMVKNSCLRHYFDSLYLYKQPNTQEVATGTNELLAYTDSKHAQNIGKAALSLDNSRGPADELEVMETRLVVTEYLEALRLHSAKQSNVLKLRFIEDASISEVAKRLGVPVRAVQRMQDRGLMSMRKLFDGKAAGKPA